jgi:hypothetical protein
MMRVNEIHHNHASVPSVRNFLKAQSWREPIRKRPGPARSDGEQMVMLGENWTGRRMPHCDGCDSPCQLLTDSDGCISHWGSGPPVPEHHGYQRFGGVVADYVTGPRHFRSCLLSLSVPKRTCKNKTCLFIRSLRFLSLAPLNHSSSATASLAGPFRVGKYTTTSLVSVAYISCGEY